MSIDSKALPDASAYHVDVALRELSRREILQAVAEYDRLGQVRFLETVAQPAAGVDRMPARHHQGTAVMIGQRDHHLKVSGFGLDQQAIGQVDSQLAAAAAGAVSIDTVPGQIYAGSTIRL